MMMSSRVGNCMWFKGLKTSPNGIDHVSIDNNVKYRGKKKVFFSLAPLKTAEIRWVFYFNAETFF